MFCPLDFHAHSLERKPDGRPRFLDLQPDCSHSRIFQKELFRQILRRAFQKLVCVLFQPHFNECTDFSIMDGNGQIVCLSRFSRIRVQISRHDKFLPQRVLLGEDAMICKYFQILDLYFIHSFILSHSC